MPACRPRVSMLSTFPVCVSETYSMLSTSCNANLCTITFSSCMLPRLTATEDEIWQAFWVA